jgi:hypothetical protein
MAADCKGFDKCILGVSEVGRWVEFAGWQRKERPQSTVAVNAKSLVVLATVCEPTEAGITGLAVDVRLNAAAVASPYVRYALTHRNNLDT